jgi:CDP-2,3-bis-(O-geranylgeranyl)-sn-glycerol synthase
MTDPLLVLQVLVLLGVANGVPVVATKLCKKLLTAPLDGGLQFFDGRPLFGVSKSLRGIVASIAITSLVGAILGFDWSLGAALAGLSMLGDLGSSFVKRRMGLEVHAQALGLDQIPEALLPLLVLQTKLGLSWVDVAFLVLAFLVLGLLLSRVLYKFGIREQPY